MRRILLTGGSGLLALNWARVASREWTVHRTAHARLTPLDWSPQHTVALDGSGFGDLLDRIAPEIIVHTAGLTSVEACERDPEAARHANVALSAAMARAASARGIKIVHVSTDHLWDGRSAMTAEEAPPTPVNAYGRTKAEAEGAVLSEAPEALVVRTNFYGWGPGHRPSFSDRILKALRERKPIGLFTDVFFTPVLIDPLVEIVHGLVARGARGVIHVGSDDRVSKHGFGLKLASAFGLSREAIGTARLSDMSELAPRPHDMSLSVASGEALLGRRFGTVDEQLARLASLEGDVRVQEIRSL